MPSKRIAKETNDQFYFLTFTIRHWYYILDRYDRWEILKDSLNYCIENKGLHVMAYVFMLNHMHLIVQSPDVAGFVRDFKKHTAREIMKNIQKKEPELERHFMNEEGRYQIWKKTNMPILIKSEKGLGQKWQYIEANPVKKRYVFTPEHWWYSSANPQSPVRVRRTI